MIKTDVPCPQCGDLMWSWRDAETFWPVLSCDRCNRGWLDNRDVEVVPAAESHVDELQFVGEVRHMGVPSAPLPEPVRAPAAVAPSSEFCVAWTVDGAEVEGGQSCPSCGGRLLQLEITGKPFLACWACNWSRSLSDRDDNK